MTKQTLVRFMIKNDLVPVEIAKELKCSAATIYNFLAGKPTYRSTRIRLTEFVATYKPKRKPKKIRLRKLKSKLN